MKKQAFLVSVSLLVALLLPVQSAEVDICPFYTESFEEAVRGIASSEESGCQCEEMAILDTAAICAGVLSFSADDKMVTCTPSDDCGCYLSSAADGDEGEDEELTAPDLIVQKLPGPYAASSPSIRAAGADPAQVVFSNGDGALTCVLQVGGDAGDEPEGGDSDDDGDDDDDDDDDGAICIEADRIPSSFAPFHVHKKHIAATVLCVKGSDIPCGTKHHALLVNGVASSYQKLCQSVECFKKRALVNAVYKHRWVDTVHPVDGLDREVHLQMGDARVPNVIYAGAHLALDYLRQVQATFMMQGAVVSVE